MNDENIIYVDTDSIYLSVLDLIPEENKNDREFCRKYSAKFCQDVAEYINQSYDDLTLDIFNTKEHFLNIEADACSDTAIWLKKKKYAMFLFAELSKNKFYEEPKLKVLGLDTVRSSFPILFQEFLQKMIIMILSKHTNESVNTLLREYKEKFKTCDYVLLSKNSSVKQISKYEQTKREPFITPFIKKTPAHVKAAIAFNDFIKSEKLGDSVETIFDGEKVKMLYLKDNPYKIDALVYRNDGKDPKEIMNYIETYLDRNKMFKAELSNKIDVFYTALKWHGVFATDDVFNELFE